MRLNRPIGIFLLLWPTLIALWFASNGHPDLRTVVIFALGVVIMRSAGCVINDYADRDFDIHVKRTKHRPLTSKAIAPQQGLWLFFALLSAAFLLVLQLNLYTILLAIIAAALAISYPFTKRFFNYPQLILGFAFAWSIPMAYTQVQGRVPMEAWGLFVATVAWVIAYDTQYAMADKADDLRLGIKSTAITFGKYDKGIIFLLQMLCLIMFAYIGWQRETNLIFYVGLGICLVLSLYQQWLIWDRIPARCFAAFLQNNYFGMLLFLVVVQIWL